MKAVPDANFVLDDWDTNDEVERYGGMRGRQQDSFRAADSRGSSAGRSGSFHAGVKEDDNWLDENFDS